MSLSTLRTGLAALVVASGVAAAPTAANQTASLATEGYKVVDVKFYDECQCKKDYGYSYEEKVKFDCDVSCISPCRHSCSLTSTTMF